MIIKRKLFSAGYNNLDNRLSFKEFRQPRYKPFGPWKSDYLSNARQEKSLLNSDDQRLVETIRKHIEKFPTMIGGPYRQHPLWDYYDGYTNEFVVWSADITKEDRMVYLLFKGKNEIWISNLLGHRVFDQAYSDTPKTPSPIKSNNSIPRIGKDGRIISPKHKKNRK